MHIHSTLALLIAALATATSIAQPAPDRVRGAVKQVGGIDAFLKEMAKSSARNFPQQLSSELEVLGVVKIDLTMYYTHRLSMHTRSQIHDVQDLRSRMSKQSEARLCTASISGVILNDYPVIYKYTVISKSGEYLFEYEIKAQNCSGYSIGGS
jgi:hypothetical protein